jgi:hypothetical protein
VLLLQAKRQPVYVVESSRQHRLSQLQALAPAYPSHLMADYRQAALDNDCYKVCLLSADDAVWQ